MPKHLLRVSLLHELPVLPLITPSWEVLHESLSCALPAFCVAYVMESQKQPCCMPCTMRHKHLCKISLQTCAKTGSSLSLLYQPGAEKMTSMHKYGRVNLLKRLCNSSALSKLVGLYLGMLAIFSISTKSSIRQPSLY